MSAQPSMVINIGVVGVARIVILAVSLIATIILARLLDPEDFGIYAACLVLIHILTSTSVFGLDAAAIQRHESPDRAIESATAIRFLLSLLVSVLLIVLAPFIADILGDDRLVAPIRVSSVAIVVGALGFETLLRLQRNLQFKLVSIVNIANTVVWSGCALLMAYLGFRFWSLLLAYIAGLSTVAAALWIIRPYKVLPRIDPDITRELLRFAIYPFGAGFVALLVWNVDKLAIGAVLSSSALLGAYYVAFNYGTLIPNLFTSATSTVMFPTFSRIQRDVIGLRRRYLLALKYIGYLSIPAGAGLAVVSRTFIYGVLGPQWAEAVVPLSILSVVGILSSITSPAASVFLATGNPDKMFRQTWVTAVMFFALLVPFIRYLEIVGASIVFLIVAVVSCVWVLRMVADILGFSLTDELRMLAAPAAASTVMAATTYLLSSLMDDSILSLGVLVSLAIPTYVCCITLMTKGEILRELKGLYASIRLR